jgi:hypothetical protein
MKTSISIIILVSFLVTGIIGPMPSYAQLASPAGGNFVLPAPGVMVRLSPPLEPPILKGIKVHPDNPFRFDFILDQGDSFPKEQLRAEATKLIKYFLASLTIPEKDLWVNLSPYEKDRIIPQSFGMTEMGRDLLAEDYMLKQITASLIYPEDAIGKKFWKRIYEVAAQRYGTTNIPVNTFNKVWIVPEKAVVYENAKAGTAYVVEAKLKVMLEQDYLALEKNLTPTRGHVPEGYVSPSTLPTNEGLQLKASQGNNRLTNELGSQIVREIVIPELTKEVNEDKNFAQLRQVYNSLILATWYKKKIKDSILEQVYADKKKVAGVGYENSVIASPKGEATASAGPRLIFSGAISDTEKIYQRYLQAFKKGVYNYIKEDIDPATQETIPRKYFSGGTDLALTGTLKTLESGFNPAKFEETDDRAKIVTADLAMQGNENASSKDHSMSATQILHVFETMQKLSPFNFHSDKNGQDYQIQVLLDYPQKSRVSVDVQYLYKGMHFSSSHMLINLTQTTNAVITSGGTEINENFEAHRNAGLKTWLNNMLRTKLPGVPFESSINNHQTLLGIHRLLAEKIKQKFGSDDPLYIEMANINKEYEGRKSESGEFLSKDNLIKIKANIYKAYKRGVDLNSDELATTGPVGSLGRTLGPHQEIRPMYDGSLFDIEHFILIGRTTSDQAMNVPLQSKKDKDKKFIISFQKGIIDDALQQRIMDAIAGRNMQGVSAIGRSLIISLPKPVLIEGKKISQISVKGVVNSAPVAFDDSKNPITQPVQTMIVGHDGKIVLDERIIKSPQGTMLWSNAEKEYDGMKGAFEKGIPTGMPVGFGQWSWKYLKQKVGFVVIAEEGPRVDFVQVLRQNLARLADSKINDKNKAIAFTQAKDMVLEASFILRQLHKSGIIHKQPKFHQFAETNGKIRIYDFETSSFLKDIGRDEFNFRVLTDVYVFFTDIMRFHLPIADQFFRSFYEGYFAQKDYKFNEVFGFIKAYRVALETTDLSLDDFMRIMKQDPFAIKILALPVDEAMNASTQGVKDQTIKGGIDLTPANMNLQTKVMDSRFRGNDSTEGVNDTADGIKFYLDPAMLAQLQNAPGFVPVIINVQPLKSLTEFLEIASSMESSPRNDT